MSRVVIDDEVGLEPPATKLFTIVYHLTVALIFLPYLMTIFTEFL